MIKKLAGVLAGVLLGIVALSSSALAAGSLLVSVEPASGSYQTGTTNALSLYGTTSGANTAGFSFTVSLSNMTIDHFDSTGNPFSIDSIAAGGAQGSTSVTITVGYSDPAGGSGKLLVGKLYTLASSSASTATAVISGIQAYDANLAVMSGSASNGTYSITAPPAAPATCPSGQTGTPPNCTTPATTTTCPTGQTGTPPNCKTPSTVTIPKSAPSGGVGQTTPEAVPETKVQEILTTEAPDAVKTASVKKKAKKSYLVWYLSGGGVAVLLGLGFAGQKLLKKRQFNARHVASIASAATAVPSSVTSQGTPKKIVTTGQQPVGTVIRPQTQSGGSTAGKEKEV